MTPGDADRRARDLGVLALALLAVIWGYNWVVMKVGLDYVRPLPFAALRTSLSVLPLGLLLIVLRRPLRPPPVGWTMVVGLLQTTGFVGLLMWALESGGAGLSVWSSEAANGVMAMVITHHFLDAGDTRGRAQLAKDFKFLGAVRLPNTAFKANAGTEVTTDIIFLQKLHEGEAPDMKAAWLDSSGKVTNKAGEGVSVNRYFEEHPNHILGEPSMRGKMHAGEEHTVEDDGRDFVKAFGDILAGDFAGLKGTLKPSKRDLDVSAVMAMQSDIPVGGMRLEPDGKIRMRTDDDVSGNSVIVDIVPGIPWGNNAEEWHGMARMARALKERV